MDSKAHDQPADVEAEAGDVMVVGPGGVAYSFTPEAAAETSDRLLSGAMAAQGQRSEVERQKKERDALFGDRK